MSLEFTSFRGGVGYFFIIMLCLCLHLGQLWCWHVKLETSALWRSWSEKVQIWPWQMLLDTMPCITPKSLKTQEFRISFSQKWSKTLVCLRTFCIVTFSWNFLGRPETLWIRIWGVCVSLGQGRMLTHPCPALSRSHGTALVRLYHPRWWTFAGLYAQGGLLVWKYPRVRISLWMHREQNKLEAWNWIGFLGCGLSVCLSCSPQCGYWPHILLKSIEIVFWQSWV